MTSENEMGSGGNILEGNEPSAGEAPLLVENAGKGKGSLSSMWELLMQLRVLLPYLARLVPLLDRGLVKAAPDLSEVHKGLHEVESGSRNLSAQVQNQKLQLERIEEQTLRLREMGERSQRGLQELNDELHALRNWVRALALLVVLLLIGGIAAAVPILHALHSGH